MDAAAVFQQGLVSVNSRPPQYFYPPPSHPHLPPHQQAHHPFPPPVQPIQPAGPGPLRRPPTQHRDDDDASPHRIAHTLTACCRCRQRKTRCDPTLPRCLPCERSGSICEYFDTTRGKKISRFYVVKLQEQVRAREAELSQYTDDDNDRPESVEDIVRPGGLVKLNEADETPRYLGPSSGIAMTRLLMEQAKRYTDSQRISELIPDVRARRMDRLNRMQSIVPGGASISGPSGAAARKNYPMTSEIPAQALPSRTLVDRLVGIFHSRDQFFTPVLHEKVFAQDLQDVYDGATDPYKNFVVRMVLAISLRKLELSYAGLADCYYVAAMMNFEDVVRPKDLKTLQCLVLVGSYSLLTPTRNVVYHVIGLATRICQQLGLADEKTISAGYSMGLVDALQMDLRRRLIWIITGMELGLAQTMGRPNGFAKADDFIDVQFFEPVDDEHITEEGIQPGPPSQRKLAAIHHCKMRLREAEIRRLMYEKKRPEPRDASSPVFLEVERKIKEWADTAPEEPSWCKSWFIGRYHAMVISLHRPSPQIPRPSSRSALLCYESASHIINSSNQQVEKSAVDITWMFVLTLTMSLNVLLWTISYREVRDEHSKQDVEETINVALDVVDRCSERWPGTQNASQLYSIFGRACLQSYDTNDDPSDSAPSTFMSPLLADSDSPAASEASASTTMANGSAFAQNQQRPVFTQPVFGYTVDTAENMNVFNFDPNPFQQPTFRSNSIFKNPSNEPFGDGRRRPSFGYFPPDFKQPSPGEPPSNAAEPGPPPAMDTQQTHSPPMGMSGNQLPTPPDSNPAGAHAFSPPSTMSPATGGSPTPKMGYSSPMPLAGQQQPLPPGLKYEQADPPSTPNSHATPQQTPQQPDPHRTPTFAVPSLPPHAANGHREPPPQQRALPQTTPASDWFSPPPPFISPYAFSGMNSANGFWGESAVSNAAFSGLMGGGYEGGNPTSAPGPANGFRGGPQGMLSGFGFAPERHGSLSADQQVELMNILETDGVGEINNFLGMDMSGLGGNSGPDGNMRWT